MADRLEVGRVGLDAIYHRCKHHPIDSCAHPSRPCVRVSSLSLSLSHTHTLSLFSSILVYSRTGSDLLLDSSKHTCWRGCYHDLRGNSQEGKDGGRLEKHVVVGYSFSEKKFGLASSARVKKTTAVVEGVGGGRSAAWVKEWVGYGW